MPNAHLNLIPTPAIESRERVLAVAASHPLAKRRSVQAEELADFGNVGFAFPLPSALHDAITPPRTPSGRPISRNPLAVSGISEAAAQLIWRTSHENARIRALAAVAREQPRT